MMIKHYLVLTICLLLVVSACGVNTGTTTPPPTAIYPAATDTPPLPTVTPTPANTLINLGPQGGLFRGIAVDPTTPGTLYALGYTGGVFKSTDDGKYWYAIKNRNRR